ncbi:MAG: phytanoyl-CoA dioxygenase family protein, partial [Nitrospirae bacterium]|nr:phytanoyl-CoA dioxygenase family protein [Fimbriimonadaceae bacterium]
MKHHLSADQIEAYRRDGFLVVEGFLDAAELEEWRRCTDEAVAERIGAPVALDNGVWLSNHGDPDSYYSQVFTQCLKLA